MSELQTGGGIFYRLRSGAHGLAARTGQIIRRFSPWVLLVPLLITVGIITQVGHPWWKYSGRIYQETISPWILGIGFVASAIFWVLRGEFFHRWMILFTAYLLIREVQPQQAEPIGYVAAVFLLWDAAANLGKMRHIAASRLCVTLVGGGVLCYAAVVTCVLDWWSFLPDNGIWKNNLRRTLESLGHTMMVASVLGAEVLWRLGRLEESDAREPATIQFPQVSEAEDEPLRRAA